MADPLQTFLDALETSQGSFEDRLFKTIEVAQRNKQQKDIRYGQSLLNQNKFDNRLSLPILNSISDSTIYDNKKLDEVESRLESIKNEDIKRFPDQSVDFMDIYDTKLNKLKEYRSLNNQYNYYASKIPDTEKFLLDITEELSGIAWDDLDANKKLELKERLYKGTQEISEFKKFMKNNADYFSNNRDFSSDSDKVNINLIGGYNQLLKQINTFDPEGTIISEDEQRMMIQSIRDGNPDEIRGRNETIATVANSRQKGYQDQFTNAYNEYIATESIKNSPDYQKEEARIMGEFKKFDDDLKLKLKNGKISQSEYSNKIREYAEEPMNWTTMPFGEKQTTYNIQEIGTRLASLEQMMDESDANFEKETGSKYSEWMGKRTPWRTPKEPTFIPKDEGEQDFAPYSQEEQKSLVSENITPIDNNIMPKNIITGIVRDDAKEDKGLITLTQQDVDPSVAQGQKIQLAQKNQLNNPGNLRFANQTDAIGKTDNNFAIFETAEDGFQALYNQIDLDKSRDLTLEKFITKYAPPTENDTSAYIRNMEKFLKKSRKTNINNIDTKELANAIARQEGWKGNFPKADAKKQVKISFSLSESAKEAKGIRGKGYGVAAQFRDGQKNLNKIASEKYNNRYKSKYDNKIDFIEAKFEEWLNKNNKVNDTNYWSHGKYKPEDYKFFIPTKKDGKLLYYPPAFKQRWGKRAEGSEILGGLEERRTGLPFGSVSATQADYDWDYDYKTNKSTEKGGYVQFAKDFDDFRKFLQEQ